MNTERKGVVGPYQLGIALKATARKLGERRGSLAVAMLSERLLQATGDDKEGGYSYIWRSAIEEHEQDSYENSHRSVLVDALRDAALGATEKSSDDAFSCVEALLKSKTQILVRIGIYICGENYGSVGHVFWSCVRSEWFTDTKYWHEIFWFIRKAFCKFSTSQMQKFLDIVDQVYNEKSDEVGKTQKLQRDLLHPAFGLGNDDLDARYLALVDRWGAVREHPDFHLYSIGGFMGEQSPTTVETLVAASSEELRKLLDSFNPDIQTWDGPTYRGFAATISAAVRASEQGFSSHFQVFRNQLPAYQHGLLRGLKERWVDDKRDICWDAAIEFIESIVENPTFPHDLDKDPVERWEPSMRWVVTDVADLLKSGSKLERSMPPALLVRCLEVLKRVLTTLQPELRAEADDAVLQAINSPRGRALEALIHVALAMRRDDVDRGSEGGSWALVGPILEAELASTSSGGNPDFSALAGMYCINFHYLNGDWTERNIDRIFSLTDESSWRCAVQGFAHQSHLYDWLYRQLAVAGHLQKMIVSQGLPSEVSERAIEFVGVAYLKGLETLETKGMLTSIVESLDQTALSHLSWFYWTLRPRPSHQASPHGSKVLQFWHVVEERIQKDGRSFPELRSALSLLAVFLDCLAPPMVEVWEAAAPHADRRHYGYVFLEEMVRLVDRYPKQVARVFEAALGSFLPVYREKDVVRCVTALAAAGHVDEAERICDLYARGHSDILKVTYQKIRAQQKAQGG